MSGPTRELVQELLLHKGAPLPDLQINPAVLAHRQPPDSPAKTAFRQGMRQSIADLVEAEEIPPAPPTPAVGDLLPIDVEPLPTPATGQLEPMAVTVEDVLAALQPFAFIAGRAGTGKTTLARQVLEQCDDAVLTATTGIAAVNLGNASTLMALLQYFDTASLQEKALTGQLAQRLQRLRMSGIRIILVDEVSMWPDAQLTTLVEAIEELNRGTEYDRELYHLGAQEDLRMKLLLVGDFAQLPPVEAPYAFESPLWNRFAGSTLKLEKVWRQDNKAFADALHAVRLGKAQEALTVLRPCFRTALDPHFDGTTIVAKNAMVDVINNRRHAEIDAEPIVWSAVKSGEQHKDWIKTIPEQVRLKPGALVMCLMNRPVPSMGDLNTEYYYVNGDLAIVQALKYEEGIDPQPGTPKRAIGIDVTLLRTGEVVTVVPHTKEWTEPVSPPEAVDEHYVPKPGEKIIRREGARQIVRRVKGAVTYMPLRLAWATTVHKSQGLSLDRVQVGIGDWMFNKPGMMYVALSRCRTLEGLRIIGSERQFLGKCAVEKKVQRFL